MDTYFELVLEDKIYAQRTPNSKFVEFSLSGEKLKTYDELPEEIKEIVTIMKDMEQNSKKYFDYMEEDGCDGIKIINIKKIDVPYIKIPEFIDGLPVTRIGEGATQNLQDTIKQIQLPENLNYLYPEAFRNLHKLKKINIPLSVKYIGGMCFENCYNLSDINLEHITLIGLSAFENCRSLKSVNLPLLEELIHHAFSGCERLSNVNLGNNLKSIPMCAFKNCPINEISIPDSVERILKEAFYGCNLKKFIGSKNLKTIREQAFANNRIEEVRLSDNTDIYNDSFINNPIKIFKSKDKNYIIEEER